MTDDSTFALARQLSHEDARRYLESRGWSRGRSSRSEIAIFRRGEHEAVLPIDRELRDYASAMLLFARRVAEAESRSPQQVLADLSATGRDRHRPALVGLAAPIGASLDATSAMIDGISRGLLAAACSTLHPRPFHPRMSLGDAEAFIAEARFVTAETGSFVLVIDTPTDVEGARESFGREASVVFVRSLAHVASAIRAGLPDRIVNPEPTDPVVSANLCEAILRMAPASESADLRFGVTWSPLVPVPSGVPNMVRIDRDMYEAVERVSRELRPAESGVATAHLCIVKELKGAPGPTGKAEGEVVLVVVQEDGTTLRAKAQLSPEHYRTALIAHATPAPVVVKAALHRVRRGYELRNVSEIEHWEHDVGRE